jgi:hypothetical protein
MVSLLLDLLNIPDNNDLFTTALISLFSCHVSYIIWFDSAGPRKLHLEEAVEIFIQNGANPKAIVLYLDKRVPLIHAIIYTLHINKHCTENHWKAFQALMKHDILRDQFGEVVWGFNYISPLTLATVLGEGSIVKILLRFGPNRFWWGPTSEFNRQRLVNLMVAEAAVDFISTWCIPPLNSGDKIRLKQIGFAVFPEEDGAALHLTSSESHQQWQRARISFAKLKASKVTIPSIYPQIDIVQIVSSQISKEVMTVLGKPIISEEPRHLLLGLEQDTNSAGQMIHAKPSGESIALYLCNRNFQQAYECTLNGMDLAIIFHRIFRVPLQILVDFLEFVGRCNPQYWKLVLKRMAYTTGSAWIEFLESCIPRPPTTGPQSPLSNNRTVGDSHGDYLAPSLWLEPLIAARFTDTIRKSSTSFEFATSLEMACAADDIQVVQHLLDCSNHHTSGMGRLLIIASINHSVRTVRLIILYKVSEEMATSALGALIKNLFATYDDLEPPVKKLDLSWPRSSNAVLEVAELLVKAGADTSIDILKDAIENWNGLLLDWNIRPKLRVFLKSVVSPAMDV